MNRIEACPKRLEQELARIGVRREEAVACAQADLTLDGAFAEIYLLLTRKALWFLCAQDSSKTHVLSGYPENSPPAGKTLRLREYYAFPLQQLRDPAVEKLVTGGLFHIRFEDRERALCMFTNQHANEVYKLRDLIEKCLKGEPIEEKDLQYGSGERYCPKCGAAYPEEGRAICPKCMDRRSVFIRTLSFFAPYKFRIILMGLCVLLVTGMNIFWPYLSGTILYDGVLNRTADGSSHAPAAALAAVVLTMLGTKVIQQFFGILQGYIVANMVPDVVHTIKNRVFDAMQKLSISFFARRQTGGLMTRVNNDANDVMGFFIDGLPYLAVNGLTILVTAAVMFILNWKLAIAACCLLPLLYFISRAMGPRLNNLYGRRHRTRRNLTGQINDNITGARVVKAFGQEESEVTRFSKHNRRVRDAEMAIVGYDNRFYAAYVIVETISTLLVWCAGAFMILDGGGITYGTLITFVGYVGMLKGPLDFMSYIFRWWSGSLNCAQRIFEILDATPEIYEKQNAVPMPRMVGDVLVRNVSFSYEPNKNVLTNISLHAPAGGMIGLVGHSGAGKTTIANLISRLYDPDQGEILIDGVDLREMSLTDLRKNVAMVSQETYIFMGTIWENIAYANPGATRAQIVAAAIAAHAHDFICKLPDGYDTMVGSGGRSLSGGERQRLSIARAILVNPRILILDEATASVDTETERNIQKALDQLIQGRTTISIAHRLSTLRGASMLYVISEGKITEQGTHEELSRNQEGTYYKLLQLQNKALALRGIE